MGWESVGTVLEIPKEIKLVSKYSDGLIIFKKDRYFGYMNIEGEIKIKPQYIDATLFDDGLAAVRQKTGQWVIIDKEEIPIILIDGHIAFMHGIRDNIIKFVVDCGKDKHNSRKCTACFNIESRLIHD